METQRSQTFYFSERLQFEKTFQATIHISSISVGRRLVQTTDRKFISYEGWNFNSGNYLFTTDKK